MISFIRTLQTDPKEYIKFVLSLMVLVVIAYVIYLFVHSFIIKTVEVDYISQERTRIAELSVSVILNPFDNQEQGEIVCNFRKDSDVTSDSQVCQEVLRRGDANEETRTTCLREIARERICILRLYREENLCNIVFDPGSLTLSDYQTFSSDIEKCTDEGKKFFERKYAPVRAPSTLGKENPFVSNSNVRTVYDE